MVALPAAQVHAIEPPEAADALSVTVAPDSTSVLYVMVMMLVATLTLLTALPVMLPDGGRPTEVLLEPQEPLLE